MSNRKPSPPAPEVADAIAQLDAIPADLVPDAFRDAVMRAATAQAVRRELAELKARELAELQHAFGQGKLPTTRAQKIAGLELLERELPVVSIPEQLKDEALGLAAERIRLAAMPAIPVPASQQEFAAWRSVGNIDLTPPAPAVTPAEAKAVVAVNELRQLREPIERTAAAWLAAARRGGLDVLAHLAAARGVLGMLEDYRRKHDQVVALVAEADAARAAAGLRWIPPSGVLTPELAELASSRRS